MFAVLHEGRWCIFDKSEVYASDKAIIKSLVLTNNPDASTFFATNTAYDGHV